jgi:hypothetical protein
VPEQQNWLAVQRTAEVNLQTIAEVIARMQLNSSAKRFKPAREELRNAIDCLLVVARGFNLDQFANGSNHAISMLFEVAQAVSAHVLLDGY